MIQAVSRHNSRPPHGKSAILDSFEGASGALLSPLGLAVHSLNLKNLENTIFQKVSAATSRQGVDAGIITLLLPHRSSGPTHRFPGLRPSLVRVLRAPAPLRNPLARLKAKISFPPSRRQTRHTASRRPPTTIGVTPAFWNLASAPHRAGSRPKDVSQVRIAGPWSVRPQVEVDECIS